MGFVDDVLRRRRPERAWPVGLGTVHQWETSWGHDDSRFAPEEYEEYLATSNDVYSVVSARARLLAGLEMRFYRGRGAKKTQVESTRPVELYHHVNEHWCVDDQTEALTGRGWMGAADVSTDDLILSMDPADGGLKWSPVRSIYRGHYAGPMHHIRQGPMDALVTPGHKFALVDGRLLAVEDLRQGHVIRAMGSPVRDGLGDAAYSDAFVELVGWAVTEGSYARNRRRKGRRGARHTYGDYRPKVTTVVIGQKDGTQRCERIRRVLKEAGARWSETLTGTNRAIRGFCVSGETAQAILAVAPRRVMRPGFLLALTSSQREVLIDTMVSGDGSRQGNSRSFYQKDKAAFDAFLMLCAMSGYPASYRLRTWEKDHFGGPVWTSGVRSRVRTVRPRRRVAADAGYDGLVWCPETVFGTFVCRRAGHIYVTGNTRARLDRMDELSMGLWGETYWAVEPPSRQSPMGEIWWLKASRVRPAPHVTGYLDGYIYEPQMGGPLIHFKPSETVWFRYPNPIDEFSALSPLGAARLAADTAMAMMKSNRQLFSDGLQLAGLVVPPNDKVTFSPEQADDLERYLKKRFAGPDNAHKWAVLRYEAQFKQMGVSPKDAEFVSGLNMTFRQVCRAYGMQAVLHNDLEQASLGDADSLERVEWSRALRPDAQFRAEEVREQYLPKFSGERGLPDHCEFDFSQIPALQESATEVWARDTQALDRGMITINEWRSRNGLPPVPWGDAPWLPLNKAQYIDGQLQVPGGMGPQAGLQGGPQPVDPDGSPTKKAPDDEVNPTTTTTRGVYHMDARHLLEAFGPAAGRRRPNGRAAAPEVRAVKRP